MKIRIGSKLLWCNEIALEIERIIETQDVIHWNNFCEHWNKQQANFKQSSTDNVNPGNGVVRSPGDEVITFHPGVNCVASRKTCVNRLHDYKDGRLREWRSVFLSFSAVWQQKKCLWWKFSISGEYLWNRASGRLLLTSGGLECLEYVWNSIFWLGRENLLPEVVKCCLFLFFFNFYLFFMNTST